MGHSTSHKRVALGATACITHLQIPASTPLPQGVEQGSPWLFAATGWSDIKFLIAASFVTMTKESASVWCLSF